MSRGPSGRGSAGLFAQGKWHLSSKASERTCVPCIARQIRNHCTTTEVPIIIFKPHYHCKVFLPAFAPFHSIEKERKHEIVKKKKKKKAQPDRVHPPTLNPFQWLPFTLRRRQNSLMGQEDPTTPHATSHYSHFHHFST